MVRTGSVAVGVLAMVSSLASAAAPPASWFDWARRSEGRFAYSVFMGGKKVGWMVEETRLGSRAGKRVVQSITEEFTETLFDGEKSVKRERSVTSYELAGEGVIVHYETKRSEDGKASSRRAERVGGRLRVTSEGGGRAITRFIPLPKDTLANTRALERWLEGVRRPGDRFTKFSTAWENNDVNSKQVYLFRGRGKVVHDGRPLEVLRVQITIEGGRMEAQVLPDSRTVTAEVGKVLSIRLEREGAAKKMTGKPVDLMDVTAVLVDRHLGVASKVRALRLELTGLDDFKVPASHRQVVTAGRGKTVVELRRDFRVDRGGDLSKAERERFLRTTPRIQCDQKPILARAREVVGGEKEPLEKARRIEGWVHRTLEQSYRANADTALEVLENKAGDCTEHALLFVALCRAAGVPAREVGGLAYVGGAKKPSFGWHAWAEVHDGHQWVSIDPTWNQVYVDGTHLKLSEGDRDLAWTNLLGTLKMKVADVKTGK